MTLSLGLSMNPEILTSVLLQCCVQVHATEYMQSQWHQCNEDMESLVDNNLRISFIMVAQSMKASVDLVSCGPFLTTQISHAGRQPYMWHAARFYVSYFILTLSY